MSNVRHLFKADGMPTLTLTERTLLRELARFDQQIEVALEEARQAVRNDDPVLAIVATRRLDSIAALLRELAYGVDVERRLAPK